MNARGGAEQSSGAGSVTMQELERLALALASVREELVQAIARAPELFARRRAVVIHGVRLGYRLRRGSVEWDNDEALIAAIRRYVPARFSELVEVSERPRKDALAELDPVTLAVLGVRVQAAGERVIVRTVESHATADDAQMQLALDSADEAAA